MPVDNFSLQWPSHEPDDNLNILKMYNHTENEVAGLTYSMLRATVILQILQNAPLKSLTLSLYKNYNTLPIPLLHDFQILLFVHKFFLPW